MIELSANLLEWIFFTTSLIHTAFTMFTWRSATIDAAFLLATGVNGARMAIADQNAREEGIKIIIGVLMIVASTAALFLEPPPPPYSSVPQSMVSMIVFTLIAIMMIMSSATSRSVRKRIQKTAMLDVHQTIGRIEGGQSDSQVVEGAERMRKNVDRRDNDHRDS
jgi:uncharacterized protein involved in response to NO